MTVQRVRALCRAGLGLPHPLTVRGFYLLNVSPAGEQEGALFDTDEVSGGAAFDLRWKKYRGMSVLVSLATYQRKGPIPDRSWVRIQGTGNCGGPGLEADSWRVIPAPIEKRLGHLGGLLTVSRALRTCKRHPHGRFRTHVRGYFTAIPVEFINNGGLFDHRVTTAELGSTSERAVLDRGGLPVVPSARPTVAQRPIPDQSSVAIYGLLACDVRPEDLEVYDWQPTS
jgi:hypothetical protein